MTAGCWPWKTLRMGSCNILVSAPPGDGMYQHSRFWTTPVTEYVEEADMTPEMDQGQGLVILKTGRRIICETHGDIGSEDGLEGNTALTLTLREQKHHFCLQCCEDLLLERLTPCAVEDNDGP